MKQTLAEITEAFDRAVRGIRALAAEPDATWEMVLLPEAVDAEYNLFTYLNFQIGLRKDWEAEADHIGQRGLDLLNEALMSLNSMNRHSDDSWIDFYLVAVDLKLKKTSLLYLGEDPETANMISREIIMERLGV